MNLIPEQINPWFILFVLAMNTIVFFIFNYYVYKAEQNTQREEVKKKKKFR